LFQLLILTRTRNVQITSETVSGIIHDMGRFCLWSVGLWACQLCCSFGHTWKKLTQRASLYSAGLAKLFVASSQISSLHSYSVLVTYSESRKKLIGNTFFHFASIHLTYYLPLWRHYLNLVWKFHLVIVWYNFLYFIHEWKMYSNS
jgi:hypothetical protein